MKCLLLPYILLYTSAKDITDARLVPDMKCLLRAAKAVSVARGLELLATDILELLGEAIPADHAVMLLGPKANGEWQYRFEWVKSPGLGEAVQVAPGILRRVSQEKCPVWSNDVVTANVSTAEALIAVRVNSVLAVPVAVFGEVIGIIYLGISDPKVRFNKHHLELLTGVAGITAGALEKALHIQRELDRKNPDLLEEIAVNGSMVGDNQRMQQIYEFIAKVAPSDSTVLIGGESGTGKELVARAIHRYSRRADKPLLAFNCAALVETLLESELFGYERGAFTGALTQKRGKIEEAAGGTLFLDEIAELAPALQPKLLRVLQEREFERVGGTKTVKADFRLVATTNRNLKSEVQRGTFRQDLYFRLDVISVVLPPLRERRDDIPRLTEHFIAKHRSKSSRRVIGCSPEALAYLCNYDWPGNVRELESVIERAIVLGSTELILPRDLTDSILEPSTDSAAPGAKFCDALREMKRKLVLKALENSHYNCAEAARALGLHPNNLHRLMRNLHIQLPAKE